MMGGGVGGATPMMGGGYSYDGCGIVYYPWLAEHY